MLNCLSDPGAPVGTLLDIREMNYLENELQIFFPVCHLPFGLPCDFFFPFILKNRFINLLDFIS